MMSAINAIADIGGWASLLAGSAVWVVRRERFMLAVNWLLSLAVILFYYSLVLRHLPDQGWGLHITRFDVSAVAIPVGLYCCWFAESRWTRRLGAAIIVAGFANVFPLLLILIGAAESGEWPGS